MMAGICRMIDLKEITPARRRFFRGMDGGSENVNYLGLGMNVTLVGKARAFDDLQQSRLPPDHSHHWSTDGTFSVIEGWLTQDGFAGCATVWELIDYLRAQFATATGFKQKRVELTFLLVNFAFTKWFDGCIMKDKLNRIGVPLVWRHRWVESTQSVLNQYKMLISDKATFEKDEWGPWIEKVETYNDPESGEIKSRTVLRSDPLGVQILHKYPDINVDPGVEKWKEDDAWKREKVFEDLEKYTFPYLDRAAGEKARADWRALGAWHTSHPTSDTVVVGQPAIVAPGLEFRSALPPWKDMWAKLCGNAPPAAPLLPPPQRPADMDVDRTGRRRVNVEALSASTSAAEVNIVTHSRYSEADRRTAFLKDASKGQEYITANWDKKGALFFIRLEHYEGEFNVGLGRRAFDERLDYFNEGEVMVEWFERKNKRVGGWGQQPGFRICPGSYDAHRRVIQHKSLEAVKDFLPVVVATIKSPPNEPALSKDCMSALRAYMQAEEHGPEEDVALVDDDDTPVQEPRKRLRKTSHIINDDDD